MNTARSASVAGCIRKCFSIRQWNRPVRTKYWPAFGAFVALLAFVSACSSSGSGASAEPAGTTQGGTSNNQCATQAAALAKKALAVPPQNTLYPSGHVDAAQAAGKTYWIILLTADDLEEQAYAKGFVAAATSVGANARIFDGQGSPTTIVQGVDDAIASKAAGVVTVGIATSMVSGPLAAAAAAHIPYVDGYNGVTSGGGFPNGDDGHATPSQTAGGTIQGYYAVNLTGCATHAAIVGSSSSPGNLLQTNANKAAIASLCPATCTSTSVDVQPADVPTQLTSLMQSTLQRNPDINVVITGSDFYVPYILKAESNLNRKVPIVSSGGDDIAGAQSGNGIVAEMLAPPAQDLGWYFFDAMLLAATGQTNFVVTWPYSIVDKATWGTSPDFTKIQPEFDNYQSVFEKLWGVAK